jgi:hypothetical protein
MVQTLPAGGAATVTVTYPAPSGTHASAGSSSWSGVDQVTPFNAASPQGSTGTAPTQPSLSVTSAVGEQVIDAVIDNEVNTDTLVVGGSQTSIFNHTQGANIAGAGSDLAGSASVSMSWSGITGGATWAQAGVSIRPSAAPFVPYDRPHSQLHQTMVAQ